MKKIFCLAVIFLGAVRIAACAAGVVEDAQAVAGRIETVGRTIREVESAVKELCREADAGKLQSGRVMSFGGGCDWLPAAKLSFSRATFEADLDAAVDYIDRLEKVRRELQATAGRGMSRAGQLTSPEDELMRAESATAGRAGATVHADVSFNVLDSYSGDRKAKQQANDRMAESDMKRVAEERRLAESERKDNEDAKRRVMEQNARWQAELDSQATRSAEEELAWKREHSAGAFFKNLARAAAGGAVSAFTGGIAQSIGSGVADLVLRKRFSGFTPSGEYDRRYGDINNNPPVQ